MVRLDESDLASGYPDTERALIARQVGIGVLKFGDLINNRTSNYRFDLRRFTSLEGNTGIYLQMVAVRMGAILDSAAGEGFSAEPDPRRRVSWLELVRVNRHTLALLLDLLALIIQVSHTPGHVTPVQPEYWEKTQRSSAG